MSKLVKVQAVKDNDGHWFVIPNKLIEEFNEDVENDNFIDSGGFGEKYDEYMTGGDLNLTQLYAYN